MSNANYLFQLNDMHNLFCHFDGVGNDIALVKIFDADGIHKYSVTLVTPIYVKCPIEWRGAGFRLASSDEQAEFLHTVSREIKERWTTKGLDVEEKFYEYRSLFIVDVDSNLDSAIQVQFLAGRIRLHRKE